jgi:glycosyltransferase involved in cell wall biosynthesis
MIEAMACGTPVLAFRCGSVPEVIDEGVTGFVVDSVHQALKAMGPLLALDRRRVRRGFEERFTAARMASPENSGLMVAPAGQISESGCAPITLH